MTHRLTVESLAIADRDMRGAVEAGLARIGLRGDTDCVRLCAGAADGAPGLIVDRFGALVVASLYGAAEASQAEGLFALLRRLLPDDSLVVKGRAPAEGAAVGFPWLRHDAPGRAVPIVGRELGLAFEIGTDPADDFGLYLDAAKARAHVRSVARDRHVLNLFAYAGAFGVAAGAGGAASVTNVDPHRGHLAWALRNARRNGVTMRVLPDTAQVFLRRQMRRLEREPGRASFDLVIADPPAFGVGRGDERVLRLFWPELFASLRVIRPVHAVLLCNDKAFRARTSFVDLVERELGAEYTFERLGTHLEAADLTAAEPQVAWHPAVQDPRYHEPVVLAGRRR